MDAVRAGNTAVMFTDGVQQINYLEDHWLVVGFAQTATNSVYRGFWDSNAELSTVFAQEYALKGLRSQSVYDVLGKSDVDRILNAIPVSAIPGGTADKNGARENALPLDVQEELLEKHQDYLIWLIWSGLTLHLEALGLPPREIYHVNYKLIDVRANKVLGIGGCGKMESVSLNGKSGKDFLESDNLAGLKSELRRLFHENMKTCSPWTS
jgi:hypothetical protein